MALCRPAVNVTRVSSLQTAPGMLREDMFPCPGLLAFDQVGTMWAPWWV